MRMPTGKGERERILEAKSKESKRKRERGRREEPNSADGRRCSSGKFSTVSACVCVCVCCLYSSHERKERLLMVNLLMVVVIH